MVRRLDAGPQDNNTTSNGKNAMKPINCPHCGHAVQAPEDRLQWAGNCTCGRSVFDAVDDGSELVPATEKQVSYLTTLAIKSSPEPMSALALLLADLNIIELTDQEREGFLSKDRASEFITVLKEKDLDRVSRL